MTSSLAFRNLEVSPDDPVETWPTEAIEAAMERGSLPEWARLASAIRARPWGRVARTVEAVLTYTRPYGVDVLLERAISDARAERVAAERAEAAAVIRRALDDSRLTRREAARILGTSTSRLSTYATGRVTPSAAFLIALRRLSDTDEPTCPTWHLSSLGDRYHLDGIDGGGRGHRSEDAVEMTARRPATVPNGSGHHSGLHVEPGVEVRPRSTPTDPGHRAARVG